MNDFSQLKCPLCNLFYNSFENIPKILVICGHSICSKCLQSYINLNKKLICPIDNCEYDIKKIEIFPINLTLLDFIKNSLNNFNINNQKQIFNKNNKYNSLNISSISFHSNSNNKSKNLLESIKKIKSNKKINNCFEHQNRPLDILCLDDMKKICSNCALFGKHKNHNIININDYEKTIEQKSELLINLYDSIDKKFSLNKINFKTLNNECDNLLNIIETKEYFFSKKISEFNNNIINYLNIFQNKFYKEINVYFNFLKEKINYYKNFPNTLLKTVNEWKTNVENKLNILNDLNNSEEEYLKFIELNDNKKTGNYNNLIDRGDYILNEYNNINNFPLKEIKKEINDLFLNFINKKEIINKNLYYLDKNNFISLLKNLGLENNEYLKNNKNISYDNNNDLISTDLTKNYNISLTDCNISKIDNIKENLNLSDDSILIYNNFKTDNNNIQELKNNKNSKKIFIPKKKIVRTKSYINFNYKNKDKKINIIKKNNVNNQNNNNLIKNEKLLNINNHFKFDIINLSRKIFDKDEIKCLYDNLIKNKEKIKEIKLNKCGLTNDEINNIFKILEGCKKLNNFNIANNLLTEKCINNLLNFINNNKNLKTIYLTNNHFDKLSKEKIKIFSKNKNIKIFI